MRRHFKDKLLNRFELIRYYGDEIAEVVQYPLVNSVAFIVQSRTTEKYISSSSAHEAGGLCPLPGQGRVAVVLVRR